MLQRLTSKPQHPGLIAVAIAALLLSGCSLIPSAKEKVFTAEPKVGDCWQATNKQANDWLDWQGFAPVDCSKKHTLETVEVPAVEGDYRATGLGGADEYPDEYKQAAADFCNTAWVAATKNAKRPNRILNFLFFPTPEKFAAGERWVRCDVGVFDTGTAWDQSSYNLLITEKPFASFSSSAFQLCLDSASDDIGDGGANLKVADCAGEHRWMMVRASDLGIDANEKFPGADEVSARARTACNFKKPKAVTGWFWQPPSEGQWASGDRTSFCWWAQVPPASS